MVEEAAAAAIAARGVFSIAVPGGSVLKLLSPLSDRKNLDWSKVHLWYVVRVRALSPPFYESH
jgi:6-phosphogluconolactonase